MEELEKFPKAAHFFPEKVRGFLLLGALLNGSMESRDPHHGRASLPHAQSCRQKQSCRGLLFVTPQAHATDRVVQTVYLAAFPENRAKACVSAHTELPFNPCLSSGSR